MMAPQETSSEQESGEQATNRPLREPGVHPERREKKPPRQGVTKADPATSESAKPESAKPESAKPAPPKVRPLEPQEWADWDKLVSSSPQGSIFCRSWWMNAVAEHPSVIGYFENDRLIAGLPLATQKRFGISMNLMPPLTPAWGIVLPPLTGKQVAIYSREIEIVRTFAAYLKDITLVCHDFHPNMQPWLPFYWTDFHETTDFSYAIEDLSDLNRVWDNMAAEARTEIDKAEKEGITVAPCDVNLLLEMERKTFPRQRRVRREQLNRIFDAAKANYAAECIAAFDRAGKPHAASLLVWDAQRTYYLAYADNPELQASGAESFLVWQGMQRSAMRSKAFDFCGSAVPATEPFVRSFGATQLLFHRIVKCPWWMVIPLIATGEL